LWSNPSTTFPGKGFNRIFLIAYFFYKSKNQIMNNMFRGLIAGFGAYKLGGGCLGTVVVFVIIYLILGQCN
jgi:hypothetical protein